MSKNRNQNTTNQLAPGGRPGSGGGEKTKSNASCEQQVAHEAKPPSQSLGGSTATSHRIGDSHSPATVRPSSSPRQTGAKVARGERRRWPIQPCDPGSPIS